MSLLQQRYEVIKAFRDMGATPEQVREERYKLVQSEEYTIDWFRTINQGYRDAELQLQA